MTRSIASNGRPIASAQRRRPMSRAPEAGESNEYIILLESLYAQGYGPRGRFRTVGLTSSKRREGVTTVACNLALNAARSHDLRVLLVDGNHAHPSLHSIFGLPRAPGLMDLLAADMSEADCMFDLSERPIEKWPRLLQKSLHGGRKHTRRFRRDEIAPPHLSVMPAGRSDLNTYSFCHIENDGLLDRLAGSFDLVIVDLPAASSAPKSGFPLSCLEGVLFVLEAEVTSDVAAQNSLRQLKQANANILGVALNQCRTHLPKWLDSKLGY